LAYGLLEPLILMSSNPLVLLSSNLPDLGPFTVSSCPLLSLTSGFLIFRTYPYAALCSFGPRVPLSSGSLKKTVSRDFLLQIFFNESSSPKTLKITLGAFHIFSKICGDIQLRCTTGINHTGGKFCPVQAMGTISDCWQPKVDLKKKCIYMLTLLPKGV
jgi:hypothetical protein